MGNGELWWVGGERVEVNGNDGDASILIGGREDFPSGAGLGSVRNAGLERFYTSILSYLILFNLISSINTDLNLQTRKCTDRARYSFLDMAHAGSIIPT